MTDDYSTPRGPGAASSERPHPSERIERNRHSSAREPLNDLKSAVKEDVRHARDTLAEDGREAVHKLKEGASEQAHFAAHQLSGLGKALEKVGGELEGSDQQHVGRYVRQAGGNVSRFAERIRDRDAGDIARTVQQFGREQPLAFMGIAALAGLTLSRIVSASADRQAHDEVPAGTSGVGTGQATNRATGGSRPTVAVSPTPANGGDSNV